VGDWPEDPGDEEILAYGQRESLVVVTLDKDFGELAVAFGREHGGIVRLVNFPVRQQAAVCLAAIEAHGDELQAGAIVTAEPGRLRFRPPRSEDD
jgi:predicted nuclease of predicted toxin-antitoxin system